MRYLSGRRALLEVLSWLDMVQGILTRRGIVQQLKKNLNFPWEQYHALLISSLHLYSWVVKCFEFLTLACLELRTELRHVLFLEVLFQPFSRYMYYGLFNNGRGLTSFQNSQRIFSSFNEIHVGFIKTFWIFLLSTKVNNLKFCWSIHFQILLPIFQNKKEKCSFSPYLSLLRCSKMAIQMITALSIWIWT